MTTRPDLILNFIRTFRDRHGYAPTRREIGRKLNLSTSVVSYNLSKLEDAGELTVAKGIARGIVLTEG
jgi:SOS-response transcriptional repressor LexA